MAATTLVIPERFRGPPHSGNGGYVTGVFGATIDGDHFAGASGAGPLHGPDAPDRPAVEVTLRAPVPLDKPLQLARGANAASVLDGQQLIAEVSATRLRLEVPEPASWAEALALRPTSAALHVGDHRWLGPKRIGFHPICFCCGAELAQDAGLHVYAAPVPARHQVAAAWTAPESFADESGRSPPPIVCTALDCPGQYAWLAEGTRTGMLGRLEVHIARPVRAGEQHVVIGWTLGNEGRKYYAGTALFDPRGDLCAFARATWIGRVED